MAANERPIRFRDHLPEAFRPTTVDGVDFLSTFLTAFERLFEELEAEIEGRPGAASGGIPDLFSPALTPPAQFVHRIPGSAADFLGHLASWTALPLRDDQDVAFNRGLFDALLRLIEQRGTLPGLDAMLRAWLRGDLLPSSALLIVTDLTRAFPDVDAVFQLGRTATLGVDTVLGEGPPFFFIVDLVTDPAVADLRAPAGLDRFQRAARALIEAERPAHTYYQLRVRAHTMQLAPTGQTTIDGRPGAQIGRTTLLWDSPVVHDGQ
jgi:phage tail-like protein